MESAGYRIDSGGFAGSTTISSSFSYHLTGSAAQSLPAATSASVSYRMPSGLRHELLRTIAIGDIDDNGNTDPRDTILATTSSPVTSTSNAWTASTGRR